MAIRTFGDVRGEIARAGLTHNAVARQMGLNPVTFSRQTKDLRGRPSPEFVARFRDALDVLTAGLPTG